MPTAIHRQVEAARKRENPQVIARLPSGWAVLGAVQVLRGYCLLLPDPVVPHLNALQAGQREQFLADMARLGDVVLKVTGATRINYEMLGNLEPALHAHLFPRYPDKEPAELRVKPVWFYNWQEALAFNLQRDQELILAIRQGLAENLASD